MGELRTDAGVTERVPAIRTRAAAAAASATGLTIALDARELVGGVSGDRTYWLGLFDHLFELDPGVRYLLYFLDPAEPAACGPWPANVEARGLTARPGWLWTPLAWPRALRRERADLAHGQYLIPPLAPCPTLVTIHDVSFLTHPEWFPARQLKIMRALIPLSARRATRILTGSRHAAEEIVRGCGVPAAKITVSPYGAHPRYRPQPAAQARRVAARYGLLERYLLAVGLLQPRKNLSRLIDAFAGLAARHPELRLALVGRRGWQAEEVNRRVAERGLADRVVLCHDVPDSDLVALYAAAEMLVYPSLYEGFGLPPLEAMACGTPVIASNSSSLPEVVGDGGLLIDPTETAAIAAAIDRVLTEPGLRDELSAAGRAQAAKFSWRKCAAEHLRVYHQLARR